MDQHLPPHLRALLDPACYTPAVPQVELVQTHISWVLLAGDWAYKIKKPVKLRFLDFSTLELRRHFCHEELRLNQRFAPTLYHSVLPMYASAHGLRFDGSGTPVEYAVKMRRFTPDLRLDVVCERGALHSAHVSDLAATLARLHASAAVAANGTHLGAPATIMAPVRDNCADLLATWPQAALQQRVLALRDWSEAQFAQLAPLMHARQQAGWVRECHGDLHLGNLVLLDGHVTPFDCIEFNTELRWIDTASDLAFVYADLLAHQQPGLACWFLNEIFSHSGDYAAAVLLRFYAVYRALVRAKVAAIEHAQGQTGADNTALGYLALAERLAAPQRPCLTITHGLSGCGKTTASGALLQADATGATLRLRADVERKRLFGLTPLARSHSDLHGGLYTQEAHAKTYTRLRELTVLLLQAGWSVLVDAAFLRRSERDAFHALAQAAGADFAILAPKADLTQLRQRIVARAAHGADASEATLAVLEHQLQVVEALSEDERSWLMP